MNRQELGAATLVLIIVLLITTTLIILFSATYSILQQKMNANQNLNYQAFEAAEAGLEYGFSYLATNSATVLASQTNNAVNDTLATTTLGNHATYTVTYTTPANNFTVVTITSTGTSSDGTSTRVVTQQAAIKSNTTTASALARGTLSLVGGSTLSNLQTNLNIEAGSSVTINNGAYTITSSGTTSSQGNYGADLQQNVSSLSNMTDSAFFQNAFGESEATVKSAAQSAGTYYNNSVSGGDYSQTLANKNGETIWIDQANVTLGQGVTIGTATSPVTLIVNGNLNIANGVTFYGFAYVASMSATNTFTLAGGAVIYGAIGASGNINISNGFKLSFNKIATGGSSTIAKIPGSWRDF